MNVFFPESDAEKAVKTAPQAAVPFKASKTDPKPGGAAKQRDGGDFLRVKSNIQPVRNDPHIPVTKDDVSGLHFERALPGDKRLG